MNQPCPQAEAFLAINDHVTRCTHCARKWAGLRREAPYCEAYQSLAAIYAATVCTCTKQPTQGGAK